MRLARVLSDGVILQRERENKIWGFDAKPGNEIKVSIDKVSVSGVADKDGEFIVSIPAFMAGGPYEITVEEAGANKIVIKDVLFGDVFLLAGQSNMELFISETLDLHEEHIESVNNTNIRQFEVPKEYKFGETAKDLNGGEWKCATKEHIRGFSALGFYYAERVNESMNIPVGLYQTAVGGAHIEALMPEDKVLMMGDKLNAIASERGLETKKCNCTKSGSCRICYRPKIEADKDEKLVKATNETEVKAQENWDKNVANNDLGFKENWFKKTSLYDSEEEMKYLNIPDLWEEKPDEYKDIVDILGSVWVLKNINLTKEQASKKAKLFLGTAVDTAEVWVNKKYLGRTFCRYNHVRFWLDDGVLTEGENTIVIRIVANARSGGMIPEMPYMLRLGDEIIDLEGKWQYRIGYELPGRTPLFEDITFYIWRPVGLYNQMLYPLKNCAFKGMMFYQGESNADHAWEYEYLLREFVKDMRELYNDEKLPFMYIQLPYWGQEGEGKHSPEWDYLRDAQKRASDMEYSTMVDIYDLGFEYELHPQNKKEVADRVFEQWKIYE